VLLPAPPIPSAVAVTSSKLRAESDGAVPIGLGCGGGNLPCEGTVALRTAKRSTVAVPFTIAADGTATATVQLDPATLVTLVAQKKLTAKVKVTTAGETGPELQKLTVTLRRPALDR
jgi:hypothetical protein